MTNITIPDIIDYPEFFRLSDQPELFKKMLCYIIEPYEMDGYSLYIGFREGHSFIRTGDFKSNNIDPNYTEELTKYIETLVEIMKSIRVMDAIFYFSSTNNELILVDMMLSANKFAGPGMLKDIFGNIFKTQDILGIEVLDDETTNKYKGKLVKPSRFRYLQDEDVIRPQYGILQ